MEPELTRYHNRRLCQTRTISSAAVNSDFSDIATAMTASIASDGQTTISGQLKFPSGSAAAPSHTFGVDLTTGMYYAGSKQIGFSAGGVAQVIVDGNNTGTGASGALLYYANGAILNPVGMVVDFAGGIAPAGWLLCGGQSVSTMSYPELFQAIQYTYGGSGTSFSLPDARGRASFGKDNMGGTPAGRISAGLNFDGTVLRAAGGNQASGALLNHTHGFTGGWFDTGHAHGFSGGWFDTGHIHSITNQSTQGQSADHTHQLQGFSGGSGNNTTAVQGTGGGHNNGNVRYQQ